MPGPGTRVSLTARPGCEEWLAPERVAELARHFGDLLPVPVEIIDDGASPSRVNGVPVWDRAYATPRLRRTALLGYCERTLGFLPLDVIELDIPVAGLRGVACVLPEPVGPAQAGKHRVYLKGMLLTDDATGLLPDWAFFVRCVISADGLRPTASREGLYQDATLSAVQEGLGGQIRDWLAELAASRPADLRRFLLTHHLAVKALARFDTRVLRIMLPWLPFETTDGELSLDEFTRNHRAIFLSKTVEEFHQVAAIASAAGLAVVNGGYTYDGDLVRRLPELRPEITVTDLDPATVIAHLDLPDPGAELAATMFLATARKVLDPIGCDVVLRTFTPASVPALLLDDREARHERARTQAAAEADGLWAGILDALRGSAPRAQLVLNQLSPLVHRVIGIEAPELAAMAIEALYGHALLMSRRPLRPPETAMLNRAFLGLLDHTGDSARAERALQDMLTLPRDQMSDCPACEDRLVGEAHLQAGRDGKALKAWADVLSGKRTCQEEPHIILSMSLLPSLRLGRGEEASANHTRGYQIVRGNTNLSGAIGRHLEFCALIGNAGRGLEILADSRPMLTAVTDPLPRLELLAGVAVLLRRLAATGYGGVPLFSGTAGELAGQVTAEATEIAAGFDARNGTTGVSDELRQRLDREPFGSIVRLGRPGA